MKMNTIRLRSFLVSFTLLALAGLVDPTVSAVAQDSDDQIRDGAYRLITAEEEARTRAAAGPSRSSRGGLTPLEIPASFTGTGFSEWIEYQEPLGAAPPEGYPLLVCWHGYGQSCFSVSIETNLHIQCKDRDWIYLSITGAIQTHFGFLTAQIHCTKAIEYLINVLGLQVDTNRIYMAGFSMGAGAAASYACRHMAEGEGYPVAGIVLVSSLYDWIHAYESGDAGVQYWLPLILGGPPSNPFYVFKYKQISTLFIKNGTYVLDESMGQNLRHKLPVFLTYAGNDPMAHNPIQNGIFVDLLDDLDCEYLLDYHPYHVKPHSWGLLDEEAALNYLSLFSLEDQESNPIDILADRDAKFYWTEVDQAQGQAFSRVTAETVTAQNLLDVQETMNVDSVTVHRDEAGLTDGADLLAAYHSTDPDQQVLELEPLSEAPTYLVDNATKKLFSDYAFDGGAQRLSITLAPSTELDLKVSYQSYHLTLVTDPTVKIDEPYGITLGGGGSGDHFLLIFSLDQMETKVGQNYLLLQPFHPSFLLFHQLDGGGGWSFKPRIPNDAGLVGYLIHHQYLTYENYMIKEISNLAVTGIIQ